VFISLVPILIEYWRHRRTEPDGPPPPRPGTATELAGEE
jgi:hypothetical protein